MDEFLPLVSVKLCVSGICNTAQGFSGEYGASHLLSIFFYTLVCNRCIVGARNDLWIARGLSEVSCVVLNLHRIFCYGGKHRAHRFIQITH